MILSFFIFWRNSLVITGILLFRNSWRTSTLLHLHLLFFLPILLVVKTVVIKTLSQLLELERSKLTLILQSSPSLSELNFKLLYKLFLLSTINYQELQTSSHISEFQNKIEQLQASALVLDIDTKRELRFLLGNKPALPSK